MFCSFLVVHISWFFPSIGLYPDVRPHCKHGISKLQFQTPTQSLSTNFLSIFCIAGNHLCQQQILVTAIYSRNVCPSHEQPHSSLISMQLAVCINQPEQAKTKSKALPPRRTNTAFKVQSATRLPFCQLM